MARSPETEEKRISALRAALKENPPPKRPLLERFEEKVIRTPESGCWLWDAFCDKNGYGHIQVGGPGKHQLAHRVSWLLYVGKIPDGLCVLHKCDVPSCVNPDHLFLGTIADNNADMLKKGRHKFPDYIAANKQKTHCVNGHPFDKKNTYLWNGMRQCKACKYAYEKRHRETALL